VGQANAQTVTKQCLFHEGLGTGDHVKSPHLCTYNSNDGLRQYTDRAKNFNVIQIYGFILSDNRRLDADGSAKARRESPKIQSAG
jgi:hypothetical protein